MLRAVRKAPLGLFSVRHVSSSGTVPSWATVDPWSMSAASPGAGANLVAGQWVKSERTESVVDPLNGEAFLEMPDTQPTELAPFVKSLKACPRSGLHNPLKNPQRYVMLGEVNQRIAHQLADAEVLAFFTRLLQRVVPKSDAQCAGEVHVVRKWLSGYGGDQVRNLGRSFALPGDHMGQESRGYRWPFGPVAVITPFNFPLEIPVLQAMSAVFMGNKCTLKVDSKVSIVCEQFLRLAHDCGFPMEDIDMLHGNGPVTERMLLDGGVKMTLFTGSQGVAEHLAVQLKGRLKLEDAGFDWKILGPDVPKSEAAREYVAWQADQDAYAFSGQKCSAQSMLFMHENWAKSGFEERIAALAARRNLEDMTCSPVLTWSNEKIAGHIKDLLAIPGARIAFGGKALTGHSIPEQYGAYEPTAVFVPLKEALKPEYYETATRELFGPLQVITEYADDEVDLVIEACERMQSFLTAAIVTNDVEFGNKLASETVNGTTYVGMRARTTAAPQNHWFGPCGDPRSAGIHTPEAIKLVWSGHREIISDPGPIPSDFTAPKAT